MSVDFVRRTQNLFEIDDEIRIATLANKPGLVRVKLVDGLAVSCLLLQDMLASDDLSKAEPDPRAWLFFQDLKRQNRLDEFLDLERRFLSTTELKPLTVNVIVGALGQVVEIMIAQQGNLNSTWRALLIELSNKVCGTASKEARNLNRRPLIRRGFLAAGGSIVTMLNLVPAASLPIPPQVVVGSVSLGTWLIEKAAEGALDRWVSSEEERN